MALVLAFLFLAAGVLALLAYGGTPHGGPTTTCGPINFLGSNVTLTADCRYVSAAEIATGVVFIGLAIFIALAARPGR